MVFYHAICRHRKRCVVTINRIVRQEMVKERKRGRGRAKESGEKVIGYNGGWRGWLEMTLALEFLKFENRRLLTPQASLIREGCRVAKISRATKGGWPYSTKILVLVRTATTVGKGDIPPPAHLSPCT